MVCERRDIVLSQEPAPFDNSPRRKHIGDCIVYITKRPFDQSLSHVPSDRSTVKLRQFVQSIIQGCTT